MPFLPKTPPHRRRKKRKCVLAITIDNAAAATSTSNGWLGSVCLIPPCGFHCDADELTVLLYWRQGRVRAALDRKKGTRRRCKAVVSGTYSNSADCQTWSKRSASHHVPPPTHPPNWEREQSTSVNEYYFVSKPTSTTVCQVEGEEGAD